MIHSSNFQKEKKENYCTHTILEEEKKSALKSNKKNRLCVITSQLRNTYIGLTRKHRRNKAQHHTHTNETKLFLGNTQQISDSKGRRRDVKQENVILYINERKSRNDLINIAKYDLK